MRSQVSSLGKKIVWTGKTVCLIFFPLKGACSCNALLTWSAALWSSCTTFWFWSSDTPGTAGHGTAVSLLLKKLPAISSLISSYHMRISDLHLFITRHVVTWLQLPLNDQLRLYRVISWRLNNLHRKLLTYCTYKSVW